MIGTGSESHWDLLMSGSIVCSRAKSDDKDDDIDVNDQKTSR